MYIVISIFSLCRGKIYIPQEKPCIILEGEGSRKTIITFWDHIGIDTSTTFTSEPPNVVATDIGFMVHE